MGGAKPPGLFQRRRRVLPHGARVAELQRPAGAGRAAGGSRRRAERGRGAARARRRRRRDRGRREAPLGETGRAAKRNRADTGPSPSFAGPERDVAGARLRLKLYTKP